MIPGENIRRVDQRMAETVQYGVSLFYVAGALQAQRYLANNGVPADVIARIMSTAPGKRRIYGRHLSCDAYAGRVQST